MHLPHLLALLGILPFLASAHMRMLEPLPINSPDDPDVADNLKDYEYTAPLDASGSNFPCKGYHTEETSHTSKATYKAGGSGSLKIQSNSATHGGGSCQISLSYDNGETWKVIKSMIGGCPVTLEYDFTVPQDAPSSDDVLLAWTWFNLVGNREMYMNCARVTIEGSAPGRHRRAQISRRAGELSSLPDMFACNVGQGCTTKENQNVEFPEPGDDVVEGENSMTTEPGTGFDGASAASGSSGESGGSGGSDAPVPAAGTSPSSAASPPSDGSGGSADSGQPPAAASSSDPAPAAGDSSSSADSPPSDGSDGSADSGQPPAAATSNIVVPVEDGVSDGSATASSASPPEPSASASSDSEPSDPTPSPSESSAPESSAPESSAPESSAPESSAPESSAAESSAAESSAVEPPAPAAPPSSGGGSCSAGSIICDSPTTWSMCVNGAPMSMGPVAAGTTCVDGKIT